MSQFIKFYFTSSMFDMFRTLIYIYIYIIIIRSLRLFYCITTLIVCSCFYVCWNFGVAGWGGIRVAG